MASQGELQNLAREIAEARDLYVRRVKRRNEMIVALLARGLPTRTVAKWAHLEQRVVMQIWSMTNGRGTSSEEASGEAAVPDRTPQAESGPVLPA